DTSCTAPLAPKPIAVFCTTGLLATFCKVGATIVPIASTVVTPLIIALPLFPSTANPSKVDLPN
ncbi:hypothetical protein, partial [Gallibacterium anatis]|uniref:hypothetical protein n=1 Tax=Gallibacterium anatis TaxID=750 RepID=UPI0039FCBC90